LGVGAGNYLTTGSNNVFLGNTCGFQVTTGNKNICIGYYTGSTAPDIFVQGGSSNILIGDNSTGTIGTPTAGASNYLNIGNVIKGDVATPGSITVAADPILPLGIATKQYVDAGKSKVTSNPTFNVATTGNDTTGDGSVAAPYATINHALLVAAGFDYQKTYFPTIKIADGTYLEQVNVPLFTNLGGKGTSGSQWYDGINIVGDTVSAADVAPLVIIDDTGIGGGQAAIDDAYEDNRLYVHGITLRNTDPYKVGLRKTGGQLFLGHIAWDISNNGTCIILRKGAAQSVVNNNLMTLPNNLNVFCQTGESSTSDFNGAVIDFPAGGCALQYGFHNVQVSSRVYFYGTTCPNIAVATGPKISLTAYSSTITNDRTFDSIPGNSLGVVDNTSYISAYGPPLSTNTGSGFYMEQFAAIPTADQVPDGVLKWVKDTIVQLDLFHLAPKSDLHRRQTCQHY
jgi:hypothetical protein